MSYFKNFAKMGAPILRKTAEPFTKEEIQYQSTKNLVNQLCTLLQGPKSTEQFVTEAVGLSAPQVRVSKQLFVVGVKAYVSPSLRPFPETAFFNPKVEPIGDDSILTWESCLSLPGLGGRVERKRKVKVTYLDKDGNERIIMASGFYAAVFQHEHDHLIGKLYPDRMKPEHLQSQFLFDEELDKLIRNNPRLFAVDGDYKYLN
eukprot:TRINITY_DN6707_c0_g1_i1.p1 TRINITY_DN6707_c0_g1~~TRINITY_DN6707_c0_g1_i1.p1  ORF type:complete len:203 (-),score=18.93 TRINITY_DN6707_c0_g1_i1:10-618(-)